MPTDRRTFLERSAAAVGGALALGAARTLAHAAAPPAARESPRPGARASASLHILVLGGTGFTGPEQVEHALARGHRVTVINRNRTRPDFFKGKQGVEQLIGDLSGDLSALKGRKFDAVLDIPTTAPYWVRNAAQYLAGNVKHYTFISTISVYPDNSEVDKDENEPTTPLPAGLDPYTNDSALWGRNYGALKTFSENEVRKHHGERTLIIRPGLIVGPLDRSDRFTYWPVRIDKGGEVLAPGNPTDPVQIIDSRDLAEWTIRMIEAQETGVYHATGPQAPLSMAEMLYGIKAITTAGAQFTWVPAEFLAEQQVRGWRHMPVWMPPTGRTAGFSRYSVKKAVAKGLTFRPLAVTAKDTLEWHTTRPPAEQQRMADGGLAGISAAKEAEVLAAWKAKQASGS
ncbi:MAG TPA: NAD-dependent epimerase/dehydratase family protein [Gemmatimonadaceae bacterium]|nr:NAD-dependent epimerase/dehydratase family protein [Gemmatimonadaceae bacterium]